MKRDGQTVRQTDTEPERGQEGVILYFVIILSCKGCNKNKAGAEQRQTSTKIKGIIMEERASPANRCRMI